MSNKLDGIIEVKEIMNTGKNRLESLKVLRYYIPIIDGKEINMVAATRDVAYLLGMERKYQGINSQFTKFACRMLEIDSEWFK